MRTYLFTILLLIFCNTSYAQCDIAQSGIGAFNSTNTASISSLCVGQTGLLKFTVYNLGTDQNCVIPVNTARVVLSFPGPTLTTKPFIYNGPASYSSGKFTWTYNSTNNTLVGQNSVALPQYSGDEVLVNIIGNQAGTFISTLNITQQGGISNNTSNDNSTIQLTVNATPTATISYSGTPYCNTGTASVTLTGQTGGVFSSTPGLSINASTGAINLAASTLGVYTVSYAYTNGSCSGVATTTVTVNNCTLANLNMKLFLQGFYLGNGQMASCLYNVGKSTNTYETDTIQVNLWTITGLSAANPAFTKKAVIRTDGTVSLTFPSSTIGNSYYIAVKHRNTIETWSAATVTFATNTVYDFTTGTNKAYGDGINPSMKNLGSGKYGFYSGDINKDGTIDALDLQLTENDASQFQFGYNSSDCTGDGASDAIDLQYEENNASLFLFYARPY